MEFIKTFEADFEAQLIYLEDIDDTTTCKLYHRQMHQHFKSK
jgi:hypothetical protein